MYLRWSLIARSAVAAAGIQFTMLPVNKVILMGVLADRPAVREVEGDSQMVGLSVLTGRRLRDATDRQQADKQWHRMVITQPDLVDYAETHLGEGEQVYVEGKLQTTFWRDQTFDGQSLTRILLWQDGTRVERIADHDCTSWRDARPADGGATGRAVRQTRARGGLAMAGSRVDTPTLVHAFFHDVANNNQWSRTQQRRQPSHH